jgi:hypothetical protein
MSRTIYTSVYILERNVLLSTKREIICLNCGHNIPREQIAGEMYTSNPGGERAKHLFPEGCINAKKRLISEGKLPEPELVY